MNPNDELDPLREGFDTMSPETLEAARRLLESRARPSTAFREELEDHLRRYAASSFTRRRATHKKVSVPIWRRWLGRGRRFRFWLRLRPVAIGLGLAILVLVVVAAASPSGRTAARDFARFIGIAGEEQPAAPEEAPSRSELPPRLLELEAEMGFKIILPAVLPPGLNISGVRRLEDPQGLVGVQIDYVSAGARDVAVLSIRERPAPPAGLLVIPQGEEVAINGTTAILSEPGGPLDLKLLQWVDDDLLIEIATTLSQEDLLQVARSLR